MVTHKGEIHLQYCIEFWDYASLTWNTVKKHLTAILQPLLDKLINREDGETWHLKRCSMLLA